MNLKNPNFVFSFRNQKILCIFIIAAILFSCSICSLAGPGLKVRAGNATINRGKRILYQDFIPEAEPYSTHIYTYTTEAGTKTAFCIEAHKDALGGGNYDSQILSGTDYRLLTAVLAFGYGSPYCKLDEIWPGITANDPDRAYLYTHIAATYAYIGASSGTTEDKWYKGINSKIAEQYQIGDFLRLCDLAPLDYSQSYVEYFQDASNSSKQKVAFISAVILEETGSITIKKKGEVLTGFQNGNFIWEEKGLPGAVFELRAAGNIKDSFGNLRYSNGDLVRTMKCNRKGNAQASGLYPGKYRIKEKSAPPGYILDPTSYDVTLSTTHLQETVNITNQRQIIDLTVNKKDMESKEKISGGTFALYNDEDIKNIFDELIVPAGTLLAKTSADSNGQIRFSLDLPFGKYHMKEIQPPNDYEKNENSLDLTITYPDSDVPIMKIRKDFFNKQLFHFAYLSLTKAEESFFLHQSNYQTGEDWEE